MELSPKLRVLANVSLVFERKCLQLGLEDAHLILHDLQVALLHLVAYTFELVLVLGGGLP